MWKTAIFLIVTVIVIPLATYFLDTGLTQEQSSVIKIQIGVYVIFSAITFIISSLTSNYSQVDKLWSILPILYVWIVYFAGESSYRILIMAILVTLWGLRLTYNFGRRGGYSWKFWSGEEDYRWSILRSRKEFNTKWKWMLFNFFFISYYQMALIMLMTFPIVKSMGGGPMGIWDVILALIFLILLSLETLADQQQWVFQKKKRAFEYKGDPRFEKGYLDSGLWAIVRHPNYACEQALWITFYFFSVAAGNSILNWSIAGCLLLILLFKGSADFGESISASKYEGYKKYISQVPRFVPSIQSLAGLKKSPEREFRGLN